MNKIDEKITLKDRTYQIEKFHTKGGQSLIYFAYHLNNSNSRVVIKQSYPTDLTEFEILKEINHPSLPRMIDLFAEEVDGENYHFLVMEFIEGETLRKIIHNYDVPYIQTLSWAKQLLDILIYLQTPNRRIIHKDICPNNIIVDASNKVYLIDFGISKKADNFDYITGGTENYMPPEQFLENGVTDFRSDIYSFSATIYHLLTNNKPEKANIRKAAIEQGIQDPLIPITELCENIPIIFSDIITRGMSISPDYRPKDANHMKSLFEEAERSDSFQHFLNDSQNFEPEIATITYLTKLKENNSRIQIPIKQPRSDSKIWGINSIKRGSEASYSLYFLEDAIEADKSDRQYIKNRFISVIGNNRIDADAELSRLLTILESLCRENNKDDEDSLKQEIYYYRQGSATINESEGSSKNPMLQKLYQQNPRKIKRYFFRFLLIVVPILLIIFFSLIWYFFYRQPTTVGNQNSQTVPSPTVSTTLIGKKGKILKEVNIRQNASEDSSHTGTLYPESEVEIMDIQHNDTKRKPTVWYKIRVLSYGCNKKKSGKCGKNNPQDADSGWVSSQFVTDLQ